MTKDLADLLKSKLEDLHGEDKVITTLAGLTRVFEYKTGTGEGELKKLPFPIDCNQPEPNCEDCNELFILVPDQNKRCIVYFEGGGSVPIQSLEGATKYQSVLSLVCWYNTNGFTTAENLQSRLIALFSDRCKSVMLNYGDGQSLCNVSVEVVRVYDSDPQIFSKYTYNQDKSQFLGCPFSSFKIDFKVTFLQYENEICFNPIVAVPIPFCC